MPLDSLQLDDLDWRTLVDSIRRRIAAASSGEWTLHSPVDPGVTLLELYAWLVEQRIFWLDQVPDSLVRASMHLLGARDEGTVAARTVLRVLRSAAPLGWLPRRARFELEDSDPPLVFTTLGKAVILDVLMTGDGNPVVEVSPQTGVKARAISRGNALPLFATAGVAGEVRIDFGLRSPPTSDGHARFHALIDLETAPCIAPQWHPADVRQAPSGTTLRWWLSTSAGRRELTVDTPGLVPSPRQKSRRRPPSQLRDGTHGLRRSGLISLDGTALAAWRPESPARPDTYSIWITADAARFAYPPRLRAVVPNAVVAEHRRRVSSALPRLDMLPLPERHLVLGEECVDDGDGPVETSAEAILFESDRRLHTWRAVRDTTFHAGDARVFVLKRKERRCVFGDGYRGRLPNLGTPPFSGDEADLLHQQRTVAWLGGGPRGNVGPARYWQRLGPTPVAARGAVNVVPGVGGREAQTVAEARGNAAKRLREVTRAVTADDFENLAKTTPGVDVARAHAAVSHHPCHSCPVAGAVTVFILPWAPRDDGIPREQIVDSPKADEGMLAAVRTRLDHARLVGSQVFVQRVPLRAVSLRIDLEGEALGLASLQERVEGRLRRFLDPLGGGDADAGWPFGAPLRASVLLREAQQAVGRGLIVRRVAIGLDGATPGEDCADVPIGPNALPWLESVDLTTTAAPVTGGLR